MQIGDVPQRPHDEDALVGAVLHDSYRIVSKIGEGGMGTVYEAVHIRLARKRFAVKILNANVSGSKEIYARFRREAEIATELGHESIVDVLDFNETPHGQPYMVMEFLDGQDLGTWLRDNGPLPVGAVARVLEQVGSALQAAHYRGIVHRDMKPENIFLVQPLESFKIKVLDFGISKIRDSKTVVTQHKAVFGTPYYMSPEQAEGSVEDIDHTTDIFALGAICYQCLSGALPFDAPTIPGVLYRVCHLNPEPISDLLPGIPEALDDVLARAMAKHKEDRYQRVDDFVKEVAAVLDEIEPSRVFARGVKPAPQLGPTQTGPNMPKEARQAAALRTGPEQRPRPAQAPAAAARTGPGVTAPYGRQQADPRGGPGASTTLSEATGEEAPGEELAAFGGGGRRNWLFAVGGAVLLVVGGLVVWQVSSGTKGDPEVSGAAGGAHAAKPDLRHEAAPDAAVAATPPDAAPALSPDTAVRKPTNVRVTLALVPEGAIVRVDGKRVRENPFVLPQGDKVHRLEVSARGYEPALRELRAAGNQTLRIELAPAKVTKPAGAGSGKKLQTKKPRTKKPKGPRFDDL